MAHSFDKIWSREGLTCGDEPEGKKAGKPGWEWTPSRERQLFRLVAKGNVPWKHIAITMYESAAPGMKEFAPCKSACRTHWYKMTDMKPREAYIGNRFRRERQRKQLERAFEQYQLRQSPSQSSTPAIYTPIRPDRPPMLASLLDVTFDSSVFHIDDLLGAGSLDQGSEAPNTLSPPLLTLDGNTPPDSVLSVPTPTAQDIMHRGFTHVENKQPNESMRSPVGVEFGGSSQSMHTTSIKRPAPSEFNESSNGTSRGLLNRRSIASAEEELAWTQQISKSDLVHNGANSGSVMQITGLPAVQEEPEIATTSQMTVDEVEDEMKAPRGLIGFIKYGLTKSRLSVQSMMSASGTIRSRFSSRRSSWRSSVGSGPPEDPNPFPYASYLSSRGPPPSAIQPTPPIGYQGGRQSTSLFFELILAGATDNEVARRLKALLEDIGPAQARYITRLRNSSGETALEVALALGNVPACRVLLDAGADVHARTSDGKSLSEFGRTAQSQANNNTVYIAIGACRNVILSHSHPGRMKSGKPEKAKKNAAPDVLGQLEEIDQLGRTTEGHGDAITAESAPSISSLQGHQNQNQVWPSSFNCMTHQRPLGIYLIEDESRSGSNSTFMPMTAPKPSVSIPGLLPSQQTPTPGVPDLVAYYNAVDAPGSHQRPVRHSRANTTQSDRRNTMLWNSYFDSSPDLPTLTSLFGSSTTPDMSSVAGNAFYGSVPRGLETTSHSRSAHYELLPDGRMAYILPFGNPPVPGIQNSPPQGNAPRVLNSQPRNFYPDARAPSMGSSVQLQIPMTEIEEARPIVPVPMFQPQVRASAVNAHVHLANQARYPNDIQQPRLQDSGPEMSSDLPITLPSSNPYQFEAVGPLRQASSINDTATFRSSGHELDLQHYQNDISTEMDAILFDSVSPAPAIPSYGNTFVHDWDSWPSSH